MTWLYRPAQTYHMHYHVIFDITQTEFPRALLFAPVIMGFLCLGFIVIAWRVKGIYPFSFMNAIVPTIGAALVWSITYVMIHSHYHHYQEIKTALQKSQCEVAEGIVTGFHRDHWGKGAVPGVAFMVGETEFRVSKWSAPVGFHQTGIIRDEMRVRIYYYAVNDPYVDKDITRLEIAE
jgi:hypothetical protein